MRALTEFGYAKESLVPSVVVLWRIWTSRTSGLPPTFITTGWMMNHVWVAMLFSGGSWEAVTQNFDTKRVATTAYPSDVHQQSTGEKNYFVCVIRSCMMEMHLMAIRKGLVTLHKWQNVIPIKWGGGSLILLRSRKRNDSWFYQHFVASSTTNIHFKTAHFY